MPDGEPIVVEPSAKGAMVLTGLRQTALIVGGTVSILGMVRGHDVQGLVEYVQSDTFATAFAAVLTAGTVVYGQLRELKRKVEAVTMAQAAPDDVAVIGHKRGWFGRLVDRIRAL